MRRVILALVLLGAATVEVAAEPRLVMERLPDMVHARQRAAAVLLADGRVLIAGGGSSAIVEPVIEAEVLDPRTGRSEPAGDILLPRNQGQLVATPDGGAFFLGGSHLTYVHPERLVEYWNPVERSFRRHGVLQVPHGTGAWAAVRPDGSLLVAGGTMEGERGTATDAVELLPPSGGSARIVARLRVGRVMPAGFVLPSGDILLAGGGYACCSHPLTPWANSTVELLNRDTLESKQIFPIPGDLWTARAVFVPTRGGAVLVGSTGASVRVSERSEQSEQVALEMIRPVGVTATPVLRLAGLAKGRVMLLDGSRVHAIGPGLVGPITSDLGANFPSPVLVALGDDCVLVTGAVSPDGEDLASAWKVCVVDDPGVHP